MDNLYPTMDDTNAALRAAYARNPAVANKPAAVAPPAAPATMADTNAMLRASYARKPAVANAAAGAPGYDVLGSLVPPNPLQGFAAVRNFDANAFNGAEIPTQASAGTGDEFAQYSPSSMAARAAATKALDSGPDFSQPLGNEGKHTVAPVATPARAMTESEASNAAWNNHVATVLSGMGVPDAASVAAQTPPTWDKAAGVAAINAGGGPRLLNYGPDNVIVGQSTDGSKKLNSFTGFGTAAATPGYGAAGSSPLDAIRSHIGSVMQQENELRNRGDLTGALQAHSLRNYLKSFSTLSTEAQLAHAQGTLGVQQREQDLKERQANPGIAIGNLIAQHIREGQLNAARQTKAAESGSALNPVQAIQPFNYSYDPNTNQVRAFGFPKEDQYGGAAALAR